jgi:hypothetical protein
VRVREDAMQGEVQPHHNYRNQEKNLFGSVLFLTFPWLFLLNSGWLSKRVEHNQLHTWADRSLFSHEPISSTKQQNPAMGSHLP